MHELSVLLQIVKTVDRITNDEKISRVRYIALEVGNDSGFVPMYLSKLFPAAVACFMVYFKYQDKEARGTK